MFNDNIEGDLSQRIKVEHRPLVNWRVYSAIESVAIDIDNYDNTTTYILACKGVTERDWLSTLVTYVPFNAGPLNVNDYDCKLRLQYSDNVTVETDSKRVAVYPAPNPEEKVSVYIFENKARLRWNRVKDNDTYSILLSTDNGTLQTNADKINDIVYTLTHLQCGKQYTAYIQTNSSNDILMSSKVEFELDFEFCESYIPPNPSEPEGLNKITKLNPAGDLFIRQYTQSNIIDNKMYIFGGSSGSIEFFFNDIRVYDPTNGNEGRWILLNPANKPVVRDTHATASIGGKLYTFSGRQASNDTWIFDPSSGINGEWKRILTSLTPSARAGLTSAVYNNKFYIFGGGYNETYIFDPSLNNWSKGTYGPSDRSYHKTAVTIGNKIYLFGGAIAHRGGSPTNDLWVYYPDNGTWKKLNPSNKITARAFHSATVHNNKMYIWAGDAGDHNFVNDLWVYNPDDGVDGNWKRVIPNGTMPSIRRGPTINNIDGVLYLFGGYAMKSHGDTYKYEP